MQEKLSTFLDFSRRTDALAAKLGLNLNDLPQRLGISRASLFAYRSGKAKITSRAWHRLAVTENSAGIDLPFIAAVNAGGLDQFMSSIGSLQGKAAVEDLNEQMKVFLSQTVEEMIQNHWNFLESDLQTFFESIRNNKEAAAIFEKEITNLRRKIKSFSFQLAEYFYQIPFQDPGKSD